MATRSNKVILIPTDFSTVAENAIVHGLELARLFQYRVCLLHVYGIKPGTIYNKEDAAYEVARLDLLKCKELYEQQYPVSIDTVIREGNLFKVFNNTVREIKPRMMVLGTHGKQGLQHLFGSHALRVVLDTPCPVMVVQERSFDTGYRRIVLPVNGDTDSQHLAEWVLQLSRLFKSEIRLLQPVETSPGGNSNVKAIIAQMTGIFRENNIPFSLNAAASASDFSGQVIAFANAGSADLIMTMTMPASGATGYGFSDWNERLMFNPGQVPVMFIDRADLAG